MLFATLVTELPASFPGAVVGAALGALAFVSTLFAIRHARQKRVVVVPPYPMLSREAMFAPVTTYRAGAALAIDELPPADGESPDGERLPTRAFRRRGPSMLLSARSLADMGIPVGPFGQPLPAFADEESSEDDGAIDVDVDETPAVVVSPIIVLSGSRPKTPHPLGVIKSSSVGLSLGVLGAGSASVAGLDLDDSPTQISETFFDEVPAPPVRRAASAARPKIRPVAPAEPRFPAQHP